VREGSSDCRRLFLSVYPRYSVRHPATPSLPIRRLSTLSSFSFGVDTPALISSAITKAIRTRAPILSSTFVIHVTQGSNSVFSSASESTHSAMEYANSPTSDNEDPEKMSYPESSENHAHHVDPMLTSKK